MNYMIPAGRSLKSVYWEDGPVPKGEIVTPYLGKPVTWSGG
jgi:hypothetical protein